MSERVRVLLVDDSPLFLRALEMALGRDDAVQIVGTAENGIEAVEKAERLAPDVITMDIMMPSLNGIEAVRRIMARAPAPILVLTSLADGETGPLTCEALRAGAVDVWPKPASLPPSREESSALSRHVQILAKVDVRERGHGVATVRARPELDGGCERLVAVVAGAGGTKALAGLLSDLLPEISAPILIACKAPIAPADVFARWLRGVSSIDVGVAVDGERPHPGRAVIAPDQLNLEIAPSGCLRLVPDTRAQGASPAATRLLESAAAWNAERTVAIVLAGRGSDGARGLETVHGRGGVALVQDPDEAEISDAPRAAIEAVPHSYVLGLKEIAGVLSSMGKSSETRGPT
jgi:two-component system, chemotaxis family, protein-glutamate methylesterase/glutaminase